MKETPTVAVLNARQARGGRAGNAQNTHHGIDDGERFDLAKVNHVRRLVRSGDYCVDPLLVADRIVLEAMIAAVHERVVAAQGAR